MNRNKKTNAKMIREMPVDDPNKFLFSLKIDAICRYLKSGGRNIMDAKDQKEWLESEDNKLLLNLMSRGE